MNSDDEYLNKVKAQLMLKSTQTGDEEEARKRILFRNVFLADQEGKEVLQILLKELLYTEKVSCLPEIALHNVAVSIMELLGENSLANFIDKI